MLAFTDVGYVTAGWAIALTVLGAYGLRTVRRGKALARRVPPEERRWT